MIAVAVAVIIGVVAVTCGIVADSNHPDSLAFLGVMVRTTAAQIFLAGAICTWALFAALWLLSAGIRRSRERGIELRALRAAAAGVDFEAEEAASAAAAAAPMAPNVSGYPGGSPYGYSGAATHGYPAADTHGYYQSPDAHGNWPADPTSPPTGQPGSSPATAGGGQDAAASPDDESSGSPMAFGSWEVPPDWSAPHNPPAAPEDWASHLAPPPDDAAGTHHRTPTSSTDWTNRLLPPTDDAAITHRAPSTPDYWASGRLSDLDDEATMLGFGDFLGFDPLRPAAPVLASRARARCAPVSRPRKSTGAAAETRGTTPNLPARSLPARPR